MAIEIINENRGARITKQEDGFYSVLFVNARNGLIYADVAYGKSSKFHKSEDAALRWVNKFLTA